MATATQPLEPEVEPARSASHTWPLGLGLFGLAFGLRLFFALQIPFPPLDDPAYYIQGARSLFTTHPLELTVTWNYHPSFDGLRRPGFDFWMPLTAFLIAGVMGVLGDIPLAAQLPGIIGGAGLAVLTVYLARQILQPLALPQRTCWGLSTLAGVYIAINPLLVYQSAVPDSQMIFAPLVAGALLVWLGGESKGRALGFGVLLGLAYLARGYALFLGLAWGATVLWQFIERKPQRRQILGRAALTALGLALTIGPWLARNYLTFGFLNSPVGLQTALITDYATLFNYETPINFNTFGMVGLNSVIEARLTALSDAWLRVLSLLFFPTAILPAVGLFLLWRRNRKLGPGLLYVLAMSLGSPLFFAVASTNGSFYHSAASFAPLGAVGYVYLLWAASGAYRQWRRSRINLLPVLLGVGLFLLGFQFWITLSTTIPAHRSDSQTYERVGAWLAANPKGQAVIADQPATLNYVTGLASLRLPSDEPLEVLQRLATRYGASYVVITANFGRYPALFDALESTSFRLAYRDPQNSFEIYELKL